MVSTAPGDVIDTGGHLPRFWKDDVIFFANLLGLFVGNVRQMRELKETVGEVDSYGGRLVPILSLLFRGNHNTLVLEHHPAEPLCRYFRDGLGLRLPELRVLPRKDYEEFGKRWKEGGAEKAAALTWLPAYRTHRAQKVDGYVTDDVLGAIAHSLNKPTVTTPKGWWTANNKLLLHRFLKLSGLPVISMETVENVRGVPAALRSLARQGFRSAVLKSQIGASGVGLKKLADLKNISKRALEEIPDHFFFEGEIMVQGWLEPGWKGIRAIHSPSVQLFVDGDRVYLFDATEQILSAESVHEGNIAPPPYLAEWPGLREELFRQAGLVGRWLAGEGYRGTGSVDFLVAERAGKRVPDVYVCEANARVTGATYPSVLARRFTPRGAWLMRNLRLDQPLEEKEVLQMLRRPRHLYEPGRDRGVLPINVNYGKDDLVHKGQFLCLAPTTEECLAFLDAAAHDLPVAWKPDRD